MADIILTDAVQALVTKGAEVIARLVSANTTYTQTLRELANVVVDIRAQYPTPDGNPYEGFKTASDWLGRTGPYRSAIGAMYGEVGIRDDKTVQAALRHHIGVVISERELRHPVVEKTEAELKAEKAAAVRQANQKGFDEHSKTLMPSALVDLAVERLTTAGLNNVIEEASRILSTIPVGKIGSDDSGPVRDALMALALQVKDMLDKLPAPVQVAA